MTYRNSSAMVQTTKLARLRGKRMRISSADERLQDKRDGHGDDGRDEEHAPEVQDRDDHAHGDDRQGEVPRFLHGLRWCWLEAW